MDRNELDTERRLRAMEIAFEHERQQHEVLEKKYARLKRRYVRLERSHSRLLNKSREKSTNTVDIPTVQTDTRDSGEAIPVSQMTTFAVIDLTSPRPGSNPAMGCNNASQNSDSRGLQGSQPDRSSRDDICGESPSSLLGSPRASADGLGISESQEEEKVKETEAEDESVERESRRRNMNTLFATPASQRRLHLDFTLPPGLSDPHRVVSSPLRRMQQQEPHSDRLTGLYSYPQSAHSMTTSRGELRTRTRPRLYLHNRSPERTATFAYGHELEQELEPRTHRHERLVPPVSSSVVLSPLVPTNPSSVPLTTSPSISRPGAQSGEEASLALARYLQQQENIAAYEEYEARLLRESADQVFNQRSYEHLSPVVSGILDHQRNIDPDNMTYEELLRLGEEVGDVKQERWRHMAVQVISSLPTHQWTRGHGENTCIVCQYNFVLNDRAMTLPCAHVFHEDCVDSWIRENNSCPLCKREISSM